MTADRKLSQNQSLAKSWRFLAIFLIIYCTTNQLNRYNLITRTFTVITENFTYCCYYILITSSVKRFFHKITSKAGKQFLKFWRVLYAAVHNVCLILLSWFIVIVHRLLSLFSLSFNIPFVYSLFSQSINVFKNNEQVNNGHLNLDYVSYYSLRRMESVL